MGSITYVDAVAIFQLVFFSPCLLISIYTSSKHGAMKSSGWIFLTVFCLIRIVGAAARIVTIVSSRNATADTIALVTSVLGLSPLFMASLGLISRAYYSLLKSPWNMIFSFYVVKIVHTPAIIALILCIVGATSATSPANIEAQDTIHAGIILYTLVFVMLLLLTVGAWWAKQRTDKGEGRLIFAVICALPLLFVRLLYALLAAFSQRSIFNPVTGSTTVSLFMSTLQEMAVVIVYITAGLKLPAVPAGVDKSHTSNMVYRLGRGDFGTGKLGLLSLAAAGIQAIRPEPNRKVEEGNEVIKEAGILTRDSNV